MGGRATRRVDCRGVLAAALMMAWGKFSWAGGAGRSRCLGPSFLWLILAALCYLRGCATILHLGSCMWLKLRHSYDLENLLSSLYASFSDF
jgi:hypothetical protein